MKERPLRVHHQASVKGPAPLAFNASRTFTPLMVCGDFFAATASAAAVPAASPIAIAVTVTRVLACAPRVAEWQRPATRRFSTFCGRSER